jgi:hypothetical protein
MRICRGVKEQNIAKENRSFYIVNHREFKATQIIWFYTSDLDPQLQKHEEGIRDVNMSFRRLGWRNAFQFPP